MWIENIDTNQLAEIIAGLVKQGLRFNATPKGDYWIIELTGGY